MKRDNYEQTGRAYTRMLLEEIGNRTTATVTDITEATDPHCPWDITATINGKPYYVEIKTRSDGYTFNSLKNKGFLFATAKNDGTNNLFAYVFPNDRIVMLTTPEQLEDLTPEETTVRHTIAVDEDSEEGIVWNYNIPYNGWWIYKLTPYTKISTPNNPRMI